MSTGPQINPAMAGKQVTFTPEMYVNELALILQIFSEMYLKNVANNPMLKVHLPEMCQTYAINHINKIWEQNRPRKESEKQDAKQ